MKKQIRRKNALDRWTVLTAEQFAETGRPGTYDAYLQRKGIEQRALRRALPQVPSHHYVEGN